MCECVYFVQPDIYSVCAGVTIPLCFFRGEELGKNEYSLNIYILWFDSGITNRASMGLAAKVYECHTCRC